MELPGVRGCRNVWLKLMSWGKWLGLQMEGRRAKVVVLWPRTKLASLMTGLCVCVCVCVCVHA